MQQAEQKYHFIPCLSRSGYTEQETGMAAPEPLANIFRST